MRWVVKAFLLVLLTSSCTSLSVPSKEDEECVQLCADAVEKVFSSHLKRCKETVAVKQPTKDTCPFEQPGSAYNIVKLCYRIEPEDCAHDVSLCPESRVGECVCFDYVTDDRARVP